MNNFQIPNTAEQLLAQLSRATNRSMACCVFAEDVVSSFSQEEKDILEIWGVRIAAQGDRSNFDKKSVINVLENPPAKLTGEERIAYARQHMPCIAYLANCYKEKGNIFEGIRIAADLIIEPKTAVLVMYLAELGADVSIACLASSADEDIINALKKSGVRVYANTQNSIEDDFSDSLRILDEMKPHIIVDDGAGLSKLLYMERPEYANGLIGICEETTSGVWALEQMYEEGILDVPAIAVNDSAIKTMFDNSHGTGETVILTTISLLSEVNSAEHDENIMNVAFNADFDGNKIPEKSYTPVFSGKRVFLAGYGAVGSGIAKRVHALGADVIVSETNSVAALRAIHDGYKVMKSLEGIESADIIISATGVRHTITKQMLEAAKDGAIVAIAGGTYCEVALDDLLGENYIDCKDKLSTESASWDVRDSDRCVLSLNNGKSFTVLTSGHGVNYTGGDGNPIEIMDLSFAGQFSAIAYLIENKGRLSPGVIRLPKEIAADAAAIKLKSMNAYADTPKPPSNWRITRYNKDITNK